MKLISGNIPTDTSWRVLLLVSRDTELNVLWEFGRRVAQVNNGSLLVVAVADNELPDNVAAARAVLDRIHESSRQDEQLESMLIYSKDIPRDVGRIVHKADVDLLLVHSDDLRFRGIGSVTCALGMIRGHGARSAPERIEVERILMPTSGGPATAHALRFLRHLSPEMHLDTLYVARASQGENELALGRERMRQALLYADAVSEVQTRLIQSESVTDGIVGEAADYDLVVIGATHESSIDRIVFGDVVEAVVRKSKTPVIVIREPLQRVRSLVSWFEYRLQRIIVPLDREARDELYVRTRESARPDIDYYILIGLSAAISALGLILNSPAVVIGAMLVAPLMSPIVATGLALVLGDARFLRYAAGTVLSGSALAIVIGLLLGLLPSNDPLSAEVLARTAPSLLDLGVALFAGLAGAYAICESEAAGALPGVAIAAALVPPLSSVGLSWAVGDWRAGFGALLLFTTNFVTIGTAAALVFVLHGFRPNPGEKERLKVQVRTARLALVALTLVAAALAATTYLLAEQSSRESRMSEIASENLEELLGGSPDHDVNIEGNLNDLNSALLLEITLRAPTEPSLATVRRLQDDIVDDLQIEIGFGGELALEMTYIQVKRLDPLAAPAVPTPTP